MDQSNYDLNDMLGVLKRRKWQFLLTLGLLAVLTLIITFAWPPVYRSVATILIEEEDIPSELVSTTITSYADQQIQVITQRVMTSDNLLPIIDEMGLYTEQSDRLTRSELVDMAREAVTMEMVSADVIDPRNGRPTQATIAFMLGFDHATAGVAQRVASKLVTLYLNENFEIRRLRSSETSDFMSREASRLNAEISELEQQIAKFRSENDGYLPTSFEANVKLMERAETAILDSDQRLTALEDRRLYYETQLAQTSPDGGSSGVMSPAQQLAALKAEYRNRLALYGENHPDVARLTRQIEGLEAQDAAATPEAMSEELASAKGALAAARERYTDSHPEVQRLLRVVSGLEQELSEASAADGAATTQNTATNPVYVELLGAYNRVQAEMRSLVGKRQVQAQRLSELQDMLAKTPERELQFNDLTRDLANLRAKYQDVKAKELDAKLAEEVESSKRGQRFSLIEPPIVPVTPHSPNRLAIMFLGLVLSLAMAVALVAILESLDGAIRGSSAVVELLGAAPLAVIPYIHTDAHPHTRSRRRILMTLAGIIVAIAIVLTATHVFVGELPVLWFKTLRRLGI